MGLLENPFILGILASLVAGVMTGVGAIPIFLQRIFLKNVRYFTWLLLLA